MGPVLFTLLTQSIMLVPPFLGVGGWGEQMTGRGCILTPTGIEGKTGFLNIPALTSLLLPAPLPRRGGARLTSARGRDPGCGCPLDRVGVMSIPRSGRGVCCSGEGLIWGSSGLRTPFHPPPSLWNPLIKLGAEISALKCRLCAGIQAAAPECGGHFLGPVSLNGLFVPAGPLSIRCD